ncbi:MAG: hypothetical protein J3K34DRAFT_498494 [Monoraphidium minutum]|nr:MAG: hypothetical protein J3K34DRAFT_498494 [Monoraphidium minutum]
MAAAARAPLDGMLDQLYRSMQRAENKVGGGEGVEGCYGTLTRNGVQQIMVAMAEACGLSKGSVLVDIGAGIGRPLLHAMQHPGVAAAWGVEIDPVKCSKGRAYMELVMRDMARAGLLAGGARAPSMACVPVEQLSTLEPATHAYAAWEGMPDTAKVAFGRLFVASSTLQSVAVAQRSFRRPPLDVMRELGFGELQLLKTFPVHLAGSQRQLNAYIFRKAPGAGAARPEAAPCQLPERAGVARPQQPAAAKQRGGGGGGGCGKRRDGLVAAAAAARAKGSGGKRGAAAAAAGAAGGGGGPQDSGDSCDTPQPLQQWMRCNGLLEGDVLADATSGRVRRKRRLS